MNVQSLQSNALFLFTFLFFGSTAICNAQPSDERIKQIILSKTTDVIPESIELSSTGGTAMKQLSGLVHWKRSATFIGNTEVGRKKYSVDVHVDHNDDFIRFTWGDVTYLDIEAPDFSEVEKVIQNLPNRFVDGLDGKIREVKYIRFEFGNPDAITWSGGGKEVTLRFLVGFIADGRYNYQERWKSEQVYSVKFFKESIDSKKFYLDRMYVTNRKKRTDLELIQTLDSEEAKKVRWSDNTRQVPSVNWK